MTTSTQAPLIAIKQRRAQAAALLLGAAFALAAPPDADARQPTRARTAAASDATAAPRYTAERTEVAAFIAEAADQHALDADWLQAQLAGARLQPSVQRFIMPPPAGTAKNWAAYRARFVEPVRIDAGVAFWRANEAWLEQAEQRFGVPAKIIVGVIGVETIFGRHTGNFRVIDALATLAFDFPPGRKDRSAFFKEELAQLLVWCRREDIAPASVLGSYAGAIGLPQFMPSSINRQAVDFDGNGHIDLRGSAADAIGSVANYLAAYGWKTGMPTHYAVKPPTDTRQRATLLAPDIVPSFSAAQFTEAGAVLDEAGLRHAGPLALVELQHGDAAPSHVAGTENFYVVTRYNWSSYYALAVIELGEAVAAARGGRR